MWIGGKTRDRRGVARWTGRMGWEEEVKEERRKKEGEERGDI